MARPRIYSEEQADQLFLIYHELDVTLREMAEGLGIPHSTIWKLINGKRFRAKRPYTREERLSRHREAQRRYRFRAPDYVARTLRKKARRAAEKARARKARYRARLKAEKQG